MKQPKELTDWDWPNTISVPDGYNMTEEQEKVIRANFNKLVAEHNNLVEIVNALIARRDIEFDE